MVHGVDGMARFVAFEEVVIRFTPVVAWCTVTTVDGNGRPQSRLLDLKGDRGVALEVVVTERTAMKVLHLAANPHVACSY